jgi:lactoylglutathione lyase
MFSRVLHTGVAVGDLDKTIEFYKSLGFEIHNQFEKPGPKARVATVKKGETAFELWEFSDVMHPHASIIQNHIAIYSDDLEADIDMLTGQGYKLVIPVTEGVIMRYAFVQDAAGCNYEIATEK